MGIVVAVDLQLVAIVVVVVVESGRIASGNMTRVPDFLFLSALLASKGRSASSLWFRCIVANLSNSGTDHIDPSSHASPLQTSGRS